MGRDGVEIFSPILLRLSEYDPFQIPISSQPKKWDIYSDFPPV